jgi:hypothetical protein
LKESAERVAKVVLAEEQQFARAHAGSRDLGLPMLEQASDRAFRLIDLFEIL